MSIKLPFFLASELRCKCDVARRIIESMTGYIIMEAGGKSLQKTLELLQEKIRELKKRNTRG